MITEERKIEEYEDIVTLSRPISRHHFPMERSNRAAQFAPFAALTGYEDAVSETARLTDAKIELEEDQKLILEARIHEIQQQSKPLKVDITFFKEDEKKEGGTYVTVTGMFLKVDYYRRKIVLDGDRQIDLEDIIKIESDEITFLEEL